MTREEWRTAPTGTRWMFVRSWKERGGYIVVSIRSQMGATRYLSEDEWQDWPLA